MGVLACILCTFLCRAQTYDIRDYKAMADRKTDNTQAIQKAVDDCAAHGGGMVLVPAGTFVTGMIVLKSNVNLHLNAGAVLQGALSKYSALVLIDSAEHVSITGEGVLFGNGKKFVIKESAPDRPYLVFVRNSRNVLIENGVLTEYLWDYLRARKEGRRSSGNGRRQSYQHLPMVRMTNTFLLPGEEDAEEIVAQTPHGVYVAKLGGGQVNTTTGDFVFGTTEAYLIENGRITEPLRDANLIGNGPEVLRRIDAVATDFAMTPGTCGKDGQSVPVGCGQATLRITGVTIGGTSE